MQAHISLAKDGGRELIVLGHDSPVLTYKLNEKQMEDLMGWGSTYENKKAYNTFASIVKNDFYMPQNFVSASNAFGRVAMGLHGYRIGHGEYGYDARPARRMPWFAPFSRQGRGWAGDFVGFAPRGEGFHLRRIGDHAYRPTGGGPLVAERPDNRVKPGELLSGGYGFYYKGQQKDNPVEVLDKIAIEPKIKPLEAAPRPQGQGIPYSTAITSDVYFSNDRFQEVLKSHGIVIDADKKTLTIQSNLSKVDLQYDLKPEEIQKLTANKVSGKGGVSVDARLAIINDIISKDFDTKLTKDMLETKGGGYPDAAIFRQESQPMQDRVLLRVQIQNSQLGRVDLVAVDKTVRVFPAGPLLGEVEVFGAEPGNPRRRMTPSCFDLSQLLQELYLH